MERYYSRNGACEVITNEEATNVYKILAQAATPVSEVLGKIGKEIERLFTPILLPEESKKLRLPRKLKKLIKTDLLMVSFNRKRKMPNWVLASFADRDPNSHRPKQNRTTKYSKL